MADPKAPEMIDPQLLRYYRTILSAHGLHIVSEADRKVLETVLAAARAVAHLHDQGEMSNSLLEALANAVDAADGQNEDG